MKALTEIARYRVLAAAVGVLAASGTAVAQESTGERLGLEEIVVTAQKRSENVQDVPISISVIDERLLENFKVTQLADVAAYVAGLQIDSGGSPGQTTITLRGIAPVAPGATVGSYIDETPVGSSSFYARSTAFSLDLLPPYAVQQIEVLRGPQGTLYGSSTLGGLVKYVTRPPDLSDFGFDIGADTFGVADAGDPGWAGRVAVNAPLVEGKAAVRASYVERSTPGYIDNSALGIEDQNDYSQRGGRLSFLWQAADDVSLRLSGMWQSVASDDDATVLFDFPSREPLGSGRSNANRLHEPFDTDLAYYGATVDWDLGWADFISATSYSDSTTDQVTDASDIFGALFPLFGLPAGLSEFELNLALEKWTQEFRLTSPGGERLDWLVGFFYTHEDSANFQRASAQFLDGTPIVGLDPLATVALPSTYEEYAVFGNLTLALTDRFDVSVGARRASNDQSFTNISAGAIVPTSADPGASSEDVWTYSFSPQFHVNDAAMLYARVASGYRPGGPNVVLPGAPPEVDSDSLVNYEVGLKTEFLDRRALVNVALFHMEWDDIQIVVAEGGLSFLDNAGTAETRGVELTTVFVPLDGLQLGLNAAYTDANLTEDAPSVSGLDGDRLPNIPEWSASLTAGYDFPLRGAWLGHVGGGYRYVGERLSAVESHPLALTTDSYNALDLNADISNERWTLRLYARNLSDERAELTTALATDGFGQPIYVAGTPVQPRTIGLALDARF